MTTSRIPGFHQLERTERLARVAAAAGLSPDEVAHLERAAAEDGTIADQLSENVIGVMGLPLSVATNLIVDGAEVLVPMATEESSVVAAVGNGARTARATGGITTEADRPAMIAQVQLAGVADPPAARAAILARRDQITAMANACDPLLVELGGGLIDIEARITGPFLVVHLVVDVRDAMGANAVNTMAEALAPQLAEWAGGQVGLRILSNLADRRLVRARARWRAADLGADLIDGIVNAGLFAEHDPYRAATHNKGIMNGVVAVALATGNDSRAIEAGAHAYAASRGAGYGPLSRWRKTPEGDLEGRLEMPMAVGIVGGATRAHPTAQIALRIMQADSAERLARVMAAVGLVQNFSALRALAGEGIQRGHMSLHAQNVAIAAGATGKDIARVAREMVARGTVREDIARAILAGGQAGGQAGGAD